MLSDFGLSLELDYDRKSKTAHENKIGSEGWRAKEVLQMLEAQTKSKVKGAKVKGTKPIDEFRLGCIVQYVMTEQTEKYLKHPFGEDIFRSRNVKADKRVTYLAKRLRNCLDDVLGDMLIGLRISNDGYRLLFIIRATIWCYLSANSRDRDRSYLFDPRDLAIKIDPTYLAHETSRSKSNRPSDGLNTQ